MLQFAIFDKANFRKTVGFGGTYDYRTFAVGDGELPGKVALAISRRDFAAGFRGNRALRCAGSSNRTVSKPLTTCQAVGIGANSL